MKYPLVTEVAPENKSNTNGEALFKTNDECNEL